MEPSESAVRQVADQPLRDRLRRVEGQVRGIQRMLDQGRPCAEVVTQLLSARAALDKVAEQLVSSHVDECLATMQPDEARSAIGRAIRLLARVQP